MNSKAKLNFWESRLKHLQYTKVLVFEHEQKLKVQQTYKEGYNYVLYNRSYKSRWVFNNFKSHYAFLFDFLFFIVSTFMSMEVLNLLLMCS